MPADIHLQLHDWEQAMVGDALLQKRMKHSGVGMISGASGRSA